MVEDGTDDKKRLELLLKYTRGEAKELIKDCIFFESASDAYETAIKLLKETYGHPALLGAKYRQKAETWPQIRSGDGEALRKFAIFLTGFLNFRKGSVDIQIADGYEFLRMLASKLPVALQNHWVKIVGRCRDEQMRAPKFDDLVGFVQKQSRDMNDPRIAGLGYQRRNESEKGQGGSKKQATDRDIGRKAAFATSCVQQDSNQSEEPNKDQLKTCLFCGEGSKHLLRECRKFMQINSKDKSDVCFKHGLCFGCLTKGHNKRECKNIMNCKVCGRKHPTALHDNSRGTASTPEIKTEKKETTENQQSTSQSSPTKEITASTGIIGAGKHADGHPGNPAMAIIPVLVGTSSCDNKISTYAFCDNGCGAVFIDTALRNALRVRSHPTKLLLRTMNLQETLTTESIENQIQVGHVDGTGIINLPQVFIKDQLPVSVADLPDKEDLNEWDHLQHVHLSSLASNYTCIPKVTMIIGCNVPAATMPLEIASGNMGDPYAVRTPLGWLIYGLPGKFADQREVDVNFCRIDGAHVQTGLEQIQQNLQACINMDFGEQIRESRPELSVNDRRFMKTMTSCVTKKDGHYMLPLPRINDSAKLPNNRLQAQQRAENLRCKFKKNPALHAEYTEAMEKVVKSGFAEKVPASETEAKGEKVWYMPHHGVYHPQKRKLRVVYDCAAVYKGTSLNQQLLQGPDLTNQLQGVLLRWRREPVAVTADIEAMFYQVKVAPEDCDMLRFLWWPGGQITNEIQEYRMKVHVFGAVSSPSCANFALRQVAEECEPTKPKVANVIRKAFYVDDMLQSFSSESEAVAVSTETKETLQAGGFNLTKWLSNSRQVIQSMPKDDRAKEIKDLDLGSDTLPSGRVLGVQWDVEDDKLSFSHKDVEGPPTRRNILSIVSSLYDPLGMVAPFTLKAKLILQELCRRKTGWDEEAPEDQQREWNSWIKDLQNLNQLKIDRCLKPEKFGEPEEVQLHHFADASTKGYGVVTYIRFISQGRIHCAFVMGKARVCPLKKITIPRLELTAARVAVRVDVQLTRELKGPGYEEITSYFWTDSLTVLKYLRNETSRFHTFVANRVSEIHEASHPRQWRYVPTEKNPADEFSRGMTICQMLANPRCLQGPDYLWKEENQWPQVPEEISGPLSGEDLEVKKSQVPKSAKSSIQVAVAVVNPEDNPDPVDVLINHYSSWLRLKRAVAWWLRLKKYLLRKSKSQAVQDESKFLTVTELQGAEEAIIGFVQQQSFPAEMEALKSQKKIKSTSTILNLDPMLRNSLLCVRGRLQNANIPDAAKHQVILPKVHHVTDLILDFVHRKCNHRSQNQMIATVRQKYWIVRASQRIKTLVKKCIVCRRRRSKEITQKMADLPANRVKPDEPPFSSTGMDYFGPFEIKQGRVIRKRYGVIFTCMVTRAIHLEVADSLDTSSCINAIRRFIARRGQVREITSDNGTNLVSANRELSQAIKQLDECKIQHFTSSMEIQWRFNPPAASHHGGVWERHIRTIRDILHSLLREQHMKVARSDDQLHTLMCEIEATINSRPLTRQSNDPSDLEVLTPNHLLHPQNPVYFPPGAFNEKDIYAKRRWRQVQYMANLFWKRWLTEYLPLLQKRQKWLQSERNVQVGDIVLVIDNSAPRNSWAMGKVEKINVGNQGLVRSAMVKTKSSMLLRPISKLCLLLEQDS